MAVRLEKLRTGVELAVVVMVAAPLRRLGAQHAARHWKLYGGLDHLGTEARQLHVLARAWPVDLGVEGGARHKLIHYSIRRWK